MRPTDAALAHRPLTQNQVDRILSKRDPSTPSARSGPVTTLQGTGAGAKPTGTTRAHWWILVVIAGAQLMVVLDTTIMIIALPSAQHALGFSNTDRQWVVTAYTLGLRRLPPPGRAHQRHVRPQAHADDRGRSASPWRRPSAARPRPR